MDPSRRESGPASSYWDEPGDNTRGSLSTTFSESSGGDAPSGTSQKFTGMNQERMRAAAMAAVAAAAGDGSFDAFQPNIPPGTGAFRGGSGGAHFGGDGPLGVYRPNIPIRTGGNGGGSAGALLRQNDPAAQLAGLKRKASGQTMGASSGVGGDGVRKASQAPAAKPGPSGTQDESKTGTVEDHIVFGCDVCGKQPLRDMRYHCQVCPNFDLCKECFESRSPLRHDPSHLRTMERIVIRSVPAAWRPLDAEDPESEAGKGAGSAPTSDANGPGAQGGAKQSGGGIGGPGSGGAEGNNDHAAKKFKGEPGVDKNTDNDNEESGGKVTPRRTTSLGGAIAGLAMDKMNEELRMCGIQPVNAGRLSTKAANMFMNIMSMGLSRLREEMRSRQPGQKVSRDSVLAQTLALNAMQLASVPSAKLTTDFEIKRASMAETTSMLAAIVDQLMEADEDEWFCSPVPKDEPGYYATVSKPMDLQTVSEKLDEGAYPQSSPEDLFRAVTKDVYQIWQNALFFNPAAHVVHDRATQLASQSVEVLTQTAAKLGLDIPVAAFVFKSQSKSSSLVKSPVSATSLGGSASGNPSKVRRKRSADANGDDASSTPRHNGLDSPRFSSLSAQSSHGAKRPGSARGGRGSRPSSANAEVARLQEELDRANARIDQLLKLVHGSVTSMQSGVARLMRKSA